VSPRATRPSISPLAALVGCSGLILVLNVTTHPLVSGGVFLGLACTALAAGRRRLLLLALLAGLGMLLLVPGLAATSGGLSLSLGHDAVGEVQGTPGGVAWAVLAALRVPAQVLAVVLLLLVPSADLLRAAARVSPRTALVGGLVLRLQPRLVRDVRLLREELAARGERSGPGAPLGDRIQAAAALFTAVVGSVFDRAADTALALRARGYGAPVRRGPGSAAGDSGAASWLLIGATLALVAGVGLGRSEGWLGAPWIRMFAGVEEVASAPAALMGLIGLLAGAAPLFGLRSAGSRPTLTPASGPAPALHVPWHRPATLRVGAGTVQAVGRASPLLELDAVELAPGSLTVIVGDSGAGKSTFLQAAAGLLQSTEDVAVSCPVMADGLDLASLKPQHRVGIVGMLHQDPERQSLLELVLDEVAFAAHNADLGESAAGRAWTALSELGCTELAHRRTDELSGGELQIVQLAATLVTGPSVLVLDEPTAQLDARASSRFWCALDRLRTAQPLTILVAEHRVSAALQRADRVLVLEQGRIAWDGPPTEFVRNRHSQLASGSGISPAASSLGAVVAPAPLARVQGVSVRRLARHDEPWRPLLVSGLSFDLVPGRAVALIGDNGSGKSTLLRTLRGLSEPAEGSVASGLPREGWAALSQLGSTLLTAPSASAEVRSACRRSGVPIEHAAVELAGAGLALVTETHPRDLSAGERQRLALIVATVGWRPVWLLDEPTRGLDVRGREWLWTRMARHLQAGGCVVLASHDLELCDALAAERIDVGAPTARTHGVRARPMTKGLRRASQVAVHPPRGVLS